MEIVAESVVNESVVAVPVGHQPVSDHGRHDTVPDTISSCRHKSFVAHTVIEHAIAEHVVAEPTVVMMSVSPIAIAIEHSIAWHSIAEHSIAEHAVPEHAVADHSVAEHSISRHSIAKATNNSGIGIDCWGGCKPVPVPVMPPASFDRRSN